MRQLTTLLSMYVNSILVQSLPANKVIQIPLTDTESEDMFIFQYWVSCFIFYLLLEFPSSWTLKPTCSVFLSLSQIQQTTYNWVCIFAKLHVFCKFFDVNNVSVTDLDAELLKLHLEQSFLYHWRINKTNGRPEKTGSKIPRDASLVWG